MPCLITAGSIDDDCRPDWLPHHPSSCTLTSYLWRHGDDIGIDDRKLPACLAAQYPRSFTSCTLTSHLWRHGDDNGIDDGGLPAGVLPYSHGIICDNGRNHKGYGKGCRPGALDEADCGAEWACTFESRMANCSG